MRPARLLQLVTASASGRTGDLDNGGYSRPAKCCGRKAKLPADACRCRSVLLLLHRLHRLQVLASPVTHCDTPLAAALCLRTEGRKGAWQDVGDKNKAIDIPSMNKFLPTLPFADDSKIADDSKEVDREREFTPRRTSPTGQHKRSLQCNIQCQMHIVTWEKGAGLVCGSASRTARHTFLVLTSTCTTALASIAAVARCGERPYSWNEALNP